MTYYVDLTGLKDEDDARGSGRPDAEGFFHVVAKSVDDSREEHEAVIVDFLILAGTDESQVGRRYREYFSVSERALKRLKLFGIVTGAAQPGGKLNCKDLVGKTCVIELKENQFEDRNGETKTNFKTSWGGFYRLDDKKVAHVPKADKIPDVATDVDADNAGADDDDGWDEF